MSMTKSPLTLLFIVFALILGVTVAGIGAWHLLAPKHSGLPELRLGGDFELPDSEGNTFRLADQRGRLVLMTFGFTSCPDICPLTLARFRAVLDELGPDAKRLQTVMIAVDPERDLPERLGEYVRYFDASMIGLVAPRNQLAAVERLYGARVIVSDNGDVAHSDYLYLIDDQGKTRKLFDQQASVDEIVSVIRSLLREARGRR